MINRSNKNKFLNNKTFLDQGFTFLEFILAVTLLGITSRLIIPSFITSLNKSRQKEASLIVNSIIKSTKSYYSNNTATAYGSNSTEGNFGLVLSTPKNNSDWKRINIGIGWNQLANFDYSTVIEGLNYDNSIVD